MDELERDLRATFAQLADGSNPSGELVDRTVQRSAQIRRRRHAVMASVLATIVVGVSITVASIAGAGTGNHRFQVTSPTLDEPATATTTTTPPTTTTTVVSPVTSPRRTTPSSRPTGPTTTTVPVCGPPAVVVDNSGTLTQLPDGDIQVEFIFVFGPARETHEFVLDDGTTGAGGFTKVYSPAQFGTHSFDTWSVLGNGYRSCTEHHTFDVDPAAVTPTTVPESTTSTTATPVSTSIPTETTVPETSTSIGG